MTGLSRVRHLWRRTLAAFRVRLLVRQIRREARVRERVDHLLGRVSRAGLDSLSPAERRYLYRASRFFRAPRERPPLPHENAAP